MNIIECMRKEMLIYMKKQSLIETLPSFLHCSKQDVENEVKRLIEDGTLFEDEQNKISISADKGYLKARLILNKKGYGFAQVEGFKDFFIPAYAINGAFDGDDCLVEITGQKSPEDIEGKVVKVLRRNTNKVVGTYVVGKSKCLVYPDDVRLRQIRIFKQDSHNAKNNDKVWVELDKDTIGDNVMSGKIVEVLGQANSPKAEQLSIIRAHNLFDKFDDKTLAAAKQINQEVDLKNFKNREDYTEQRVITIDGEDARDFDDALAIEQIENGTRLYVHIADVSNYVVENSALDKEAYKRATSAYFPNQVIPMLPNELSNGVCSLSEGVNRLTLSVVIDVDLEGKVTKSEVKEGVIKSRHRMTYTEITNILKDDEMLKEKYADVLEDIYAYRDLSIKLKAQRYARGEIRMNLPEPFILEAPSGEIVSIENRFTDEAHEIIESLMILANECVAEKFFKLGVPFVYRVHEKPDEEKTKKLSVLLKNMGVANQLELDGDKPASYQRILEKIVGTTKETTLTKLVLRSMMKAKYSQACLGHFGLASEFYCHFTSPIRRYPDLMIHRIIKQYINGVPVEDLKLRYTNTVIKASEQSSIMEKNADLAEREVDDYKKALYMTKFLGEKFVGTISGVQEFGLFVELDNGVEGLIRAENMPFDEYTYDAESLAMRGRAHTYKIGDVVEIIVARADPRNKQVDFDFANVEKSNLGAFVVNRKNNQNKSSKKEKHGKKNKNKKRKGRR